MTIGTEASYNGEGAREGKGGPTCALGRCRRISGTTPRLDIPHYPAATLIVDGCNSSRAGKCSLERVLDRVERRCDWREPRDAEGNRHRPQLNQNISGRGTLFQH